MNDREHKDQVRGTFDAAAGGYDHRALRFFAASAEHMLDLLELKGDEHLLDVATGTGNVALVAARRLGKGLVTGIDLSPKMLMQAEEKARQAGIGNLNLLCCDMEDMGLPPQRFDAATCGFGLFFLPDMQAGLRSVHTVLKPGAPFALTSFTGALMQPMTGLLFERLRRHDIEPPATLSWQRLDTPDKVRVALAAGGFDDVMVEPKQLGYHLDEIEDWWSILWNSGYRGLLMRLPEAELDAFRAAHLDEVAARADAAGIWLNVEVLFTLAYA